LDGRRRRTDVRSGCAAAPAGLSPGHRFARTTRRREHGSWLSSRCTLPGGLQSRGGAAAPADSKGRRATT
jgi:hypothetical protein